MNPRRFPLPVDDVRSLNVAREAQILRRHAMGLSKAGTDLAASGAVFFLTMDAYHELLLQEPGSVFQVTSQGNAGRSLFGLPYRVTIDDEEGTPPVQLFMEPMLKKEPPA